MHVSVLLASAVSLKKLKTAVSQEKGNLHNSWCASTGIQGLVGWAQPTSFGFKQQHGTEGKQHPKQGILELMGWPHSAWPFSLRWVHACALTRTWEGCASCSNTNLSARTGRGHMCSPGSSSAAYSSSCRQRPAPGHCTPAATWPSMHRAGNTTCAHRRMSIACPQFFQPLRSMHMKKVS